MQSGTILLACLAVFGTTRCATWTASENTATRPEKSESAPMQAKTPTSAKDDGSVIVRPRDEALQMIQESCHNDYEILSEGPPSSELGIAVPLAKQASNKPHWFIRYRCKNEAR